MRFKKYIKEAVKIDIKVGDTILGGRFKNKRITVKKIEYNERGEPLINGKPLMKYRLVSENIEPLPLTSCPIEKTYGGIQPGGGFKPNVEFEVGLQRMAEAAHCILGSLHRAYYTRGYLSGEFAHIEEEFDLIKGLQREYSKDLYVGRVFPLDRKYGPMAIESIRKNAPKLIKQAKDSIRRLDKKKYPKEAYELAKQSYQFLIDLAEAGLKTVSETNIKTEKDVGIRYILFNYLKKLDGAVRELGRKVNAFKKIADSENEKDVKVRSTKVSTKEEPRGITRDLFQVIDKLNQS